jgi:hypothetical protein
VYYKGAPAGSDPSTWLTQNAGQIRSWMAEGRQIIGIGPGPVTTPSEPYDMEHSLIFASGYRNYVQHILDDGLPQVLGGTH